MLGAHIWFQYLERGEYFTKKKDFSNCSHCFSGDPCTHFKTKAFSVVLTIRFGKVIPNGHFVRSPGRSFSPLVEMPRGCRLKNNVCYSMTTVNYSVVINKVVANLVIWFYMLNRGTPRIFKLSKHPFRYPSFRFVLLISHVQH